jgi:hypothetical protein
MHETRKSIWALCLTILFCSFSATRAAVLSLPERQGQPGALVQLLLTVDQAVGLAGLECLIQYDDAWLEFVEVDQKLGAGAFFTVATRQSGEQLAVSMACADGLSEAHTPIIGLTFRIKKSAELGGATEVTIRQSRLYDQATNSMAHSVEHGVVKIADLFIFPSVISPNHDNYNDVLYVTLKESLLGSAVVKIFGMSGEPVAEIIRPTGPYYQWDGRNDQGRDMPPGVYLYVIITDGKALAKGTVTVMR